MELGLHYLSFIKLKCSPVTAIEIQRATRHDPVLSQMLQFTQNVWPEHVFGQLTTFHVKQHKILVEEDCLWGMHVIIPKYFQNLIFRELHQYHLGCCRMK